MVKLTILHSYAVTGSACLLAEHPRPRAKQCVGAITHGSYEKTQGDRGLYRPSRTPNAAVQQFAAMRHTSRPTEGIPRNGNPYQQRFPPLAGTFSSRAATDPDRVYRVARRAAQTRPDRPRACDLHRP